MSQVVVEVEEGVGLGAGTVSEDCLHFGQDGRDRVPIQSAGGGQRLSRQRVDGVDLGDGAGAAPVGVAVGQTGGYVEQLGTVEEEGLVDPPQLGDGEGSIPQVDDLAAGGQPRRKDGRGVGCGGGLGGYGQGARPTPPTQTRDRQKQNGRVFQISCSLEV